MSPSVTAPAGLDSPVVTAALAATATATGMEVVFIGGLTEVDFTFRRLLGSWEGLSEGLTVERADSFCARLLAGGPTTTPDARKEPAYASVSAVSRLGVRSYVGVPIRDEAGQILGTLCGIDSAPVELGEDAVALLTDLAAVIAAHLTTVPPAGVVIRRSAAGWQVDTGPGNGNSPDRVPEMEAELVTALTLADLLADGTDPPPRPRRGDGTADPIDQLKISVAQLEHALAARVVVEQAIGVLAERHRVTPRTAFERLRRAARSRGRRVHLLAGEVVASSHTSAVPLPPELAPRRLS